MDDNEDLLNDEVDCNGNPITGLACNCGELSGVRGYCPYAREINEEEKECDCCPTCREQCAMDI